MQSGDNSPEVLSDVFEQATHPCDGLSLRERPLRKALLKHTLEHRDASELLAQAVVQILANAPLFAFGDLEHTLLEVPSLNNLPLKFRVGCSEFRSAFFDRQLERFMRLLQGVLRVLSFGNVHADSH